MSARKALFDTLARGTESIAQRNESMLSMHTRIASLRMSSPDSDFTHFSTRAKENGAEVLRCSSLQDVPELLDSYLSKDTHIVMANEPLFQRCDLAARLTKGMQQREVCFANDARFEKDHPDWKRAYAAMDVGINLGLAGIADSGAVFIAASEYESRTLSLLSMHHVVLLSTNNILGSLVQAASLLRAHASSAGSSAVTLVGGPSKTADIEKVLVTGVHGPRAFTIVVVDDIPSIA